MSTPTRAPRVFSFFQPWLRPPVNRERWGTSLTVLCHTHPPESLTAIFQSSSRFSPYSPGRRCFSRDRFLLLPIPGTLPDILIPSKSSAESPLSSLSSGFGFHCSGSLVTLPVNSEGLFFPLDLFLFPATGSFRWSPSARSICLRGSPFFWLWFPT